MLERLGAAPLGEGREKDGASDEEGTMNSRRPPPADPDELKAYLHEPDQLGAAPSSNGQAKHPPERFRREPGDEPEEDDDLQSRPVLIRMDLIEARKLAWFWPGRYALGKFALVIGDPGDGKSLM
ncbi:MAG TPA: hypothetical protein VGJ16_10750, partial [Pirellulales bacterium]